MHVCFVCLPAASVVEPTIVGGVGGAETRAWLLARELARRPGVRVSFIVRHRRPLPKPVYEGVHVHTLVDPVFNLYEQVGLCLERRPRFPWLRLKQWRWPLLWQVPELLLRRLLWRRAAPAVDPIYAHVAPDVFCTFGVQSNSARVIAAAHAQGRKALLVLGSDGDLDLRFLSDSDYVTPYGDRSQVCRAILEQADAVVCQTAAQQQWLHERFGRQGTVIENPIDVDDWSVRAGARSPLAGALPASYVLWVGRAEPDHKRPAIAVELARRLPGIPFVLVLNPRDAAEEARCRLRASPNVTFVSVVPPAEMPAVFRRAALLLNTSAIEGFPNTFLQAAAVRIPVVALAVGEEFLRSSGSGVFCDGDRARAEQAIHWLWGDPAERRAAGDRGRAYVAEHHGLAPAGDRLLSVLESLVN